MNQLELANELSQIYVSIKLPLDRDMQGLINELDFRMQWLARSAELVADAQFLLDQKRGQTADKYSDVTATMLREIIARECAEENKLYLLADRLNATLTHQIDATRSILSAEKEGLRITSIGPKR